MYVTHRWPLTYFAEYSNTHMCASHLLLIELAKIFNIAQLYASRDKTIWNFGDNLISRHENYMYQDKGFESH